MKMNAFSTTPLRAQHVDMLLSLRVPVCLGVMLSRMELGIRGL